MKSGEGWFEQPYWNALIRNTLPTELSPTAPIFANKSGTMKHYFHY